MAMKALCFRAGLQRLAPSTGARTLVSKALREKKDKPAPFPYLEKNFNAFYNIYDRTLPRFDENSKIIVVDGAHAVGKTKLAKELAEEFEMKYLPHPTLEKFYTNGYGVDFREWNEHFPDSFKIMDETDFIRDPLGVSEGSSDRYHMRMFVLKYYNYLWAIRHILNTGEGVVLEGNPYADYARFNAALNAGWIFPTTKWPYDYMVKHSLVELLKPNVIIYLDAPPEVVQKNIKARGNEWDKNSPLWSNTRYLNDIYNEYRKNYLKEQTEFSRVLVYDWSEPGDTEIVVEDIEALELDLIPAYDEQQRDWRFNTEETAMSLRFAFTNGYQLAFKYCVPMEGEEMIESPHLCPDPLDCKAMEAFYKNIASEQYQFGYNAHMGDSIFKMMFNIGHDYPNFAKLQSHNMHFLINDHSRPYLDVMAWPGIQPGDKLIRQ